MSYVSVCALDSPVAAYRMDESTGEIQDSSGNTNHGSGSPHTGGYLQPGFIASDSASKSIQFAGASDWFTIPDHATLDLGDVWTLECWVKPNAIGTDMALMAKGVNAYTMQITAAGNIDLTCVAVADIVQSTTTLSAGTAYHVVGTHTGATSKIYINGVDRTGSPNVVTTANNGNSFLLGNDPDTTTTPLDGWLDECRVYGTALTAARVLAHYNAAASSPSLFFSKLPKKLMMGRP